MLSVLKRLLPGRKTQLFRAVSEGEHLDICARKSFRNPEGLECKYFARTRWQAETYAELASKAYARGPFFIYLAEIATELITDEMRVDVEYRIQVVVVPSALLPNVSAPSFIGRMPP